MARGGGSVARAPTAASSTTLGSVSRSAMSPPAVRLLSVNLTHSLGANTGYNQHNNIPLKIDSYIPIKTRAKYIEAQNNNVDRKPRDVIEAILKKIVLIKNQKSKLKEKYVNEGNVYKFKLNKIPCGDGLERKWHSGRTQYDNGYPWLDTNIPFTDFNKNQINLFSKDYLDINDLGRSNLDGLSQDYLDVGDLSRRTGEARSFRVEMHPIDKLFNLRRSGNRNEVNDLKKSFKKQNKVRADSSDSSDETSSEHSDEGVEEIKKNRFKIVKPEDSGVSSSEEESSVELTVEKKKNIIKDESQSDSEESLNRKGVDYIYMQGRNRILNDNDSDRRRRLEHFMPKRFHWDEDELKNLGYYWFNGNRGRFAEAWRPGNL